MIAFVLSLWVALAILYAVKARVAAVVYLLALVAFPFYWAPLYIVPFNALSVQRTVAVGIAFGLILELLIEMHARRLNAKRMGVELLVAAMVTTWSLSGFGVTTFSAGVRGAVLNLIDYWVPFALAMRIAAGKDGVLSILRWLAWPALGVAALTLYEYVTQTPVAWDWFSAIYTSNSEDVWAPTVRATVLRVQATLGQSIFLGFYLACAGLLAFVLSTLLKGSKRVVALLASAFLMFCSVVPMARGSMVGAVLAFLLLAFLMESRIRWQLLLGCAGAFGLLWLASSQLHGVGGFWSDFALTLVGQAPANVQVQQLVNFQGRLDILQNGLGLVWKAPLLGYGDISLGGWWPIRDVANVFVGVGMISGLIGLTLLVVFVVFVCVQALGLWLRERNSPDRIVASGLVASLAIVVISWLDASWPGQFTQVGWLLMGTIVSWRMGKRGA